MEKTTMETGIKITIGGVSEPVDQAAIEPKIGAKAPEEANHAGVNADMSPDMYETKLWGGRFHKAADQQMEQFNNIAGQTAWLLDADIRGSIAHAAMLTRCGLITPAQGAAIHQGLKDMLMELQAGQLTCDDSFEDVHSFVELKLTERIGEAGKVLHTARSRNDQVNLDMKLYARETCIALQEMVQGLLDTLADKAARHPVPMPGYTHLQRAQTVTFKHYLMAYHGMFTRDMIRLNNAIQGMDECPLGCGALAGTTHQIDRGYTASLLGFDRPYANFLDGVSDRDYLLETLSCLSILMMHLSRLSEELILFSSQEFGFVALDEAYSTGSSIMPQKKNPDSLELIRGKTGQVYGSLVALLTVMKGLPLAYNKDMQEDKAPFYNAMQTAQSCVLIMTGVIATLKVQAERMQAALQGGFMNATEVADYLVRAGVPFRTAHSVVGRIVLYAEGQGRSIEGLTLQELQQFSPLFDESVYDQINPEKSLHLGIKKEML